MTDLYITSLKITAEDEWLRKHIEDNGDDVVFSPQYQYLLGYPRLLQQWMDFRGLPIEHITVPLMETLKSLIEDGQKNEILVYRDMRINTGHKRAACLLFLGKINIKARFIDDNYKL